MVNKPLISVETAMAMNNHHRGLLSDVTWRCDNAMALGRSSGSSW